MRAWPRSREADMLMHVASLVQDEKAKATLRAYADVIERAPERIQPVLLSAVAVAEPALAHLATIDPGKIPGYTSYPNIPPEIAAHLILGTKPVDLVPGMTKREAHEWLASGAPSPGPWILDRRCPTCPIRVPDLRVALWLADRWRSPKQRAAMLRPRTQRLFGHEIEGSYIDRMDEIRPSDLRTSVDATFQQARKRMQRNYERLLKKKGEPLAPEPEWWEPSPYVRLLDTGAELIREGRAMRHCVADYADKIRRGRSVILSIHVEGQRSTVELDRETLQVLQHKGVANSPPPPATWLVLEHYLPLWREAAGLVEPKENPVWANPWLWNPHGSLRSAMF